MLRTAATACQGLSRIFLLPALRGWGSPSCWRLLLSAGETLHLHPGRPGDRASPESPRRISLGRAGALASHRKGTSLGSLKEPERFLLWLRKSLYFPATHETVGTGALLSKSSCVAGGKRWEGSDGVARLRGDRSQGGLEGGEGDWQRTEELLLLLAQRRREVRRLEVWGRPGWSWWSLEDGTGGRTGTYPVLGILNILLSS